MAYDGQLKFETALDATGLQKGANKLGDIVKGLGLFKIIEKSMGAVVNSIDSAVSRVDTLNKFPRVMEQMGYGADTARESVDRLSDGIQGLPTALDSIVGSTQRLSIATGSLDKGTDTALALNNALLASGASNEAASRGTEQYIQSLSRGKIEGEEWKTLMETMPYAMDQVAQAFGFTGPSAVQTLREALGSSEITMSQFNDKLIELNGGVGGFAKVAQTASGGIATSWANVQTAVVRGTANVIQAVDDGLDSFGGISGVMDSVKGAVNTAFSAISNGANLLMQNLDKVALSAAGVGTAFAAYKAIQAWNVAAGEAKKVTDFLKTSQQQLTLAVGKSTAAQLEQVAAAKIQEAQDAQAKFRKLELIATEKLGIAESLKAAAAKATGTEATRLQREAARAATVAEQAQTAAKAASTVANTASTAAVQADVAAQNARNTSVGLGTALIGYLTGSITLHSLATAAATTATTIFKMALNALPLIGIAAAIGAVVVGIIALVAWLGNSDEAYNEGRQYVEDYGESNKALADDLDKTTDEFKKNTAAAEATTRTSEGMLAGLSELADEGLARTAEETYRLQAKIDALNATQQGLNLTIDETTGKLSMTTAEIEAYFGATENAARATALTDHMKALGDQLVDIESQFIDSERQIAEWKEQVENGTLNPKKYEWLVGRLNKETDALKETQAAALDEMAQNEEAYSKVLADQEAKRQALADLQEDEIRDFAAQHHLSYESIRADMDENNLSFPDWVDKNQKELDESQAKLTEFADKWGYSLDEVNAAVSASGLTIEDYVERQDKALEHAMEVIADFTANATNGFSVMDQETAISLDNFMNNMKKNEDAVANWATNMNTLMDLGVNKGVIEQLSKMGPEGAAQAQVFIDELTKLNGGVDVSLGQTNDLVASKLAEIDGAFSTGLDAANIAADTQLRAESYYGAGYASIGNIATGIEDNPAAVDATTSQMEGAKAAASEVDFTGVGQSIAAGIVSGLSGADVSGAMQGIADAIQVNTNKVTSAVTGMSNGVQAVLSNMKTQAVSTTSQAMTEISSTITSHNGNLNVAAAAAASSVVNGLQPMVPGAEDVAGNMMDGVGVAMDRKAPYLYSKAREIATTIASTMAAALDVHSPSRVMVGLFENVMMGIYVAMDGMSGMLYSEAKNIADGIADRLTISGDVASTLVNKMRAVIDSTSLGGAALVPQVAYAGAGGGSTYSPTLVQHITTPKPLSASEMTREGQDMLRRSRWQLP